MKTISEKEKTIKKWTSSDTYRDNYDRIFSKDEDEAEQPKDEEKG